MECIYRSCITPDPSRDSRWRGDITEWPVINIKLILLLFWFRFVQSLKIKVTQDI